MKKILLLLITTIFLVSSVLAIGVTYPHPQNIELVPGQASYFTFQIQTDDFPVSCVPVTEELSGLELAFNPQYQVEEYQRFNIKPQVLVPKQTAFGSYRATFCMECTPSGDVEGSKIIPRVCGLPITVNVVAERTRTNVFEEEPKAFFGIWITLLIIAIIILAIIIFYLIRKRK